MQTFTYTIFDGHPVISGPSAWPSHEDVEVRGKSFETVARRVAKIARREGRACGQYQKGDKLYFIVWDEDGISTPVGVVTL